jgi:hypothetical protein
MHSLNHVHVARAAAAERVRQAPRAEQRVRRQHPPPIRVRAAVAVARLARRLDPESARRAVA